MKVIRQIFTPFRTIVLGFAGVILLGTFLLMLPFASTGSKGVSFIEALFTATSSTCVTGLVLKDTATTWTFFGQLVILIMIQIGGMGIVTVAMGLTYLAKHNKRFGIRQRNTIMEAISAPRLGGIMSMIGFIAAMVAITEGIGTILLSIQFVPEFGLKGIWYALFHSVSAFCNAGFDIMGAESGEFSSLASYASNPLVAFTVMFLIVSGGIGFFTWHDIVKHKYKIGWYSMQSKIILIMTFALILIPAILFFFLEFHHCEMKNRIIQSLFSSVTLRTAGFSMLDLNKISQAGRALMIILMLIGGAPGSTAGGMKVTTVAVMISSAFSVVKRRQKVHFFHRRIAERTERNAAVITFLYLSLSMTAALVISRIEDTGILDAMFEASSALATVGLSLGITPSLGIISRLIIIALMFFGRVGTLTLIYAVFSKKPEKSEYPEDKLAVG